MIVVPLLVSTLSCGGTAAETSPTTVADTPLAGDGIVVEGGV